METEDSSANNATFKRLTKVGYFYCDRYRWEKTDSVWKLDFEPFPWLSLIGYSSLIAIFFAFVGLAARELNSDPVPWEVIVIGLPIIPAPFYLPILRRATTRRSRPFLSFSENSDSLFLFARRQEIALDHLRAIVDGTFSDDEDDAVSELQLSLQCDRDTSAVFVVSMLGSAEMGIRQIAREISLSTKRPHVTFDDRAGIKTV